MVSFYLNNEFKGKNKTNENMSNYLGLTKVIGDHAPLAIKTSEIKNYFGRKVAIDASMSIYQFMIAVRQEGNMLQNESGETTR